MLLNLIKTLPPSCPVTPVPTLDRGNLRGALMKAHGADINVKNTFLEISAKDAGLEPARRNQTCPSNMKPLDASEDCGAPEANSQAAVEPPSPPAAEFRKAGVSELIVKNTFLEVGPLIPEALAPPRRHRTCPSELQPLDEVSNADHWRDDCNELAQTVSSPRAQSPMSRYYYGPEMPEEPVDYAMMVPIVCQPWSQSIIPCWFPELAMMPSALVAVPAPSCLKSSECGGFPPRPSDCGEGPTAQPEAGAVVEDSDQQTSASLLSRGGNGSRRARKDIRRVTMVAETEPRSAGHAYHRDRTSRGSSRRREIIALDGTGIVAGTVLVCSQESFILDSARSRKHVRKVMVGEQVTVAGPPEEFDFHNIVVPVKPRGVVKLKHFHKVPRAPSAGPSAVWVDLSHLKPKRLPGAHGGPRLDKKPGGPA